VELAHGSHRGTPWSCRLAAITVETRDVIWFLVVLFLHSCQVGRTGEKYKGGTLKCKYVLASKFKKIQNVFLGDEIFLIWERNVERVEKML